MMEATMFPPDGTGTVDDVCPMDVDVHDDEEHSVSSPSRLNFEGLPSDAMNIILSCLTLIEFQRLSRVSKHMNVVISSSSHLFMTGKPWFLFAAENDNNSNRNSNDTRQQVVCASSSTTAQGKDATTPSKTPHDGLKHLLKRYKNLNYLHLEGLAVIGDEILSILNSSPAASSLTTVVLQGCVLSYWCPHSFHLKHLQHLTLSGGSIRGRIYSLLKHSPKLKSLSIGQCKALRHEDVYDIGLLLHNSLQSLTLNQCIRICRPILPFPSLERLSLVGCFSLTDLNGFSCPNLKYLNLSFCVRLSGPQIQDLVQQLPYLEELVMMKCSGVKTLHLKSPSLKKLNVSFSHNLVELRIDCPSLCDYESISCFNLSTVVIKNASSLNVLDLSAIPCLERLELEAPNLSHLSLQGCRRLDACQIYCPNLKYVNIRGCRVVALRFCKYVRQVLFKSWSSNI